MPSLKAQLDRLASTFADGVLAAIRRASLDELVAGAPRRIAVRRVASTQNRPHRPGRLPRRSSEDVARTLAKVVATVKASKLGMRAEQIRKTLKLDRRELPRVLHEGLASKVLRSRGHKRATTYFVR
jgi:hypothetical protein